MNDVDGVTIDEPPAEPAEPAEPAGTPVERRAPRRHRVRNIIVGVIGTVFLAWLILFITKGRFLKHPFERIAGKMTHRTVTVRGDFQLYFAPFDIKFLAEGLTVSNPDWATKPDLFAARRIDSRIAPLSLLFGRRHFRFLDLTDGAVDLEWNGAHDRNTWTFSDQKGKPFALPIIDRATLAGTTLRYRDPQLQLLADLKFATVMSAGASIGDKVTFTGTGRARATPFTLSGALLSPNQTAARGKNELTMTAHAANNVIDITGTLPSLADIEEVPLQVKARGRDLSELLWIIGVPIPRTRDYRLHAQLVKSGNDYAFTRMAGVFGDSDLSGKFTIQNILPRPHIDATLTTKRLDIVDAAPFIGYNPDIVAAQGVQAAAAATGAGSARLLPDAQLGIESMKRFDADAHWTIGTVASKKVPISNVDVTVTLDNALLKLSPFTFAMARGNVASDIILDARRSPTHASYDIRLAQTPMGRLLAGFGVADSGTTGTIKGRIKLDGVGNTLHDSLASSSGRIAFTMPAGSFWTRNVQLAELDVGTFVQKMFEHKLKEPVQINCGLVGFTVRNGVAAADPILIDTTKNVIVGRGGFSFKTEGVDMAFRADGKKFSLFSGQSPVGLGGSFAHPAIDVVSDQLLARAGVGLGLAIVATPLAGILAFVDVGDAKSAACGPVLAGATAKAQRTTKGKPRDDVGKGTTAKEENGKKSASEKKGQRKKFLGIF
ncbi:AsmA family protein [Sphingomonas oligophenolica]|uniref:AsmA family protein n=1 Tax=Sphingomonas oligophenolica TaxID=301154 RepID=A0A502CLD5_9SPHN|nr:AsmA family protein [Sphingomonas oligophenolica]TPG13552.1 AsmA family protein [Sphingomonas oligophenolica]